MKGKFLLLSCFIAVKVFAQNDSTGNANVPNQPTKKRWPDRETATVFYGQRLINAKTVEVLHKGAMAFTVVHTFGDVAGDNGGTYNFFGLDEVSDAQIGFQIGIAKRLNLVLQHTVGNKKGETGETDKRIFLVAHFYEAGLKYQFMEQGSNGSPFSLTGYGNIVSTAERFSPEDSMENHFVSSGDRLSQMFQLMIARRFGAVSLQLSGTFLHTNRVIPGDQDNLFAIGGAARLPVTKSVFIIADYFHSFRSSESIVAWRGRGNSFDFHDVFGIGVEILTAGHVFHLNFTNARNILENRFLTHTTDSWGDGEFRWGFTLTRNFMLFRDKKDK
jgi:hypothetical protein